MRADTLICVTGRVSNEGSRRLRKDLKSWRRPLLGSCPSWKQLLAPSHWHYYFRDCEIFSNLHLTFVRSSSAWCCVVGLVWVHSPEMQMKLMFPRWFFKLLTSLWKFPISVSHQHHRTEHRPGKTQAVSMFHMLLRYVVMMNAWFLAWTQFLVSL